MILNAKMFANDDTSGNRLFMRVFYDEFNKPQNSNIHLQLKGEKAPRLIGNFDFLTRTLYCKRKMSKHFHRKTKSFGFNWTILSDSFLSVENIHLIVDDEEHYLFRKEVISDYGTFLNFKQQGFELQRFMSFEIIKRYSSIPKYPNRKNDQKDSTQEGNGDSEE